MNYTEITNNKIDSFDFKVGDVFTELLSYYCVIAKIEDDIVTIFTKSQYYEILKLTKQEFKDKFSYCSGYHGYWITYLKNDTRYVSHFLDEYCKQKGFAKDKYREIKLDILL